MAGEPGKGPQFVQGDDDAILASVQQRAAQVQPLLRCAANPGPRHRPGSWLSWSVRGRMIPVKAADGLRALQLSLGDPPFQTKTDAIKVHPAALPPRARLLHQVRPWRTGRVDGDRVPVADVDQGVGHRAHYRVPLTRRV